MMLAAEGLLDALPERMLKKSPAPSQRRDQNRAERMAKYEECRRLLSFRKVSLQIEIIGNENFSHRRRRREHRAYAENLRAPSALSAPAAVKTGSKFINQFRTNRKYVR
jgi:hypothetical protein